MNKFFVSVMLLLLWASPSYSADHCPRPFYLLPMVGGVGAVELAGLKGAPPGYSSREAVKALLEQLEPGGAKGDVQVGYTLPLPLLNLYKKVAGQWQFDEQRLQFYLGLIESIDRPVAVVLLANHFSDASPLVEELAKDPRNLMLLGDGSVPQSRYFSVKIWPFTLSADPAVPVNQYRFGAMRKVLEALTVLDKKHPGRLIAVTLGGETHHLFNDLRGNTGAFSGIQYSDYSPLAKAEFRAWLQKRFKSLSELNMAAGTSFTAWNAVEPPNKDIRKAKLDGFFQHFDAYAAGHFPIYGWLHPKYMPAAIQIWVDGRHVGDATYGVNRQDVYEARQDIGMPNVGYRYDLEFRRLSHGQHTLQVVVKDARASHLLSETRFVVMAPNQETPKVSWWHVLKANVVRKFWRGEAVDGWADAPREMADVYYNPYATIWQEFRESQVGSLISAYGQLARSTGFDRGKLYSHQLQPWWNGSWNDILFATGNTPGSVAELQPGVTLYAGLTTNANILKQQTRNLPYGVPEINLLSKGSAKENDDMLMFHYQNCAHFISPYYMDVLPPSLRPKDDHNRMLVDANASTPGGQAAYRAMFEFSKR